MASDLVSQPTPNRRWLGVLFFLFWMVALGLAYWYFLVRPQQWFDPQMRQPPLLSQLPSQAQLRTLLKKQFPTLNDDNHWFIRFRQADCGCERFVELYHKSFEQTAPPNTQVRTVDMANNGFSEQEKALLRQWVPATPSVAVFYGGGDVLYFGPYHQDGICNAENSYLEPVMESIVHGEPITVFNTLVYGCFCHTDQVAR